MLKKPPSSARTSPRTPTIKNGKFVITFNVLGTPEEDPDTRITSINRKSRQQTEKMIIECWFTKKIAHVNELMVLGRARDSRSQENKEDATEECCSQYTSSLPSSSERLICHPTHRSFSHSRVRLAFKKHLF